MARPSLDFTRRWLLAALCAGLAASVWAAEGRVELRDQRADIDLWPQVTILADPTLQLQVEQILQREPAFVPPQTPRANLGVRGDAVWLRVPLVVPHAQSGRWVLDLDYPPLDRVDVHVITDGRAVQHFVLGDSVPFRQRVLPTRSHAVPLVLEVGIEHELLIRVHTTSSMIVPLRLVAASTFHAGEAQVQMVQGLMAGIGLCLMVYALVHAVSLRSAMFLAYALAVCGTTLFFYAYHGLGSQHPWPERLWLTLNAAPLAVLLATSGSLWFIDRALDVGMVLRWLSWALRGGSAVAIGSAVMLAAGLIDYRTAHVLGAVLGSLAMVLTLPAALLCARRGNRAAWYICFGWALYAVGVLTMAALLRGHAPLTPLTAHLFQAGNMAEMLSWLVILGLRAQQERQAATRVHAERDVMRSLAETDPLTGLANRRGLQLPLDAALARCAAGRLTAVYVLDLDGFKAVNDRLGHDGGDALLIAVAQRLRLHLRSGDTVARLGGDEFVVLAEAMPGAADAERFGHKLVAEVAEPFDIHGSSCRVGLTVGYALAPLDATDAGTLLRQADAALYVAKQAGKGRARRTATALQAEAHPTAPLETVLNAALTAATGKAASRV